MKVIDSHIHCGVQNADLPLEMILTYLRKANIQGACLFSPVEDVYNRYDYYFEDNAAWETCRQKGNNYVLDIQKGGKDFYAYFFVWNDFRKEEIKKGYRAIKWHRHDYEPVYHYEDSKCEEFLKEVYRLQLPILFEESYENTLYFIKRVNGRTPIIIPHMGGLNGGFSNLLETGIWDQEAVYTDTSLGTVSEMETFIARYGVDRLLFGSDFPFGIPSNELAKVKQLNLKQADYEKIVGINILKLLRVI
jgi:uncharacterized protein